MIDKIKKVVIYDIPEVCKLYIDSDKDGIYDPIKNKAKLITILNNCNYKTAIYGNRNMLTGYIERKEIYEDQIITLLFSLIYNKFGMSSKCRYPEDLGIDQSISKESFKAQLIYDDSGDDSETVQLVFNSFNFVSFEVSFLIV